MALVRLIVDSLTSNLLEQLWESKGVNPSSASSQRFRVSNRCVHTRCGEYFVILIVEPAARQLALVRT